MVLHIAVTIVVYLVLMYLSVNLLGFLVRGFFVNPDLEKLKKDGHEFIRQKMKKSDKLGKQMNLIGFLLIAAFLFVLFYFGNVGVVFSVIIIMAGRLPDLLREIRHGTKVDRHVQKKLPYYFSSFLPWLALPVLYISLYGF